MNEQTVAVQNVGYGFLILLMIGAGLLGGLTNFFRVQDEEKNWKTFVKNILMGVSASLLIPLFLNMISSNLLKESSSDSLKLFVLFGFCLISALSSKAFIQTVSDRLLNDLKKTREEVNDIKKEVEPVVSKAIEAEEEESPGLRVRAFSFDENTKKVLTSFANTQYAWRTVKGIERESGLSTDMVLKTLNWLFLNRLAVKIDDKNRILYGLTLEGRDILASMVPGRIPDRGQIEN